jgi:pimeloyl-ACP methyl ester carboxylesterase
MDARSLAALQAAALKSQAKAPVVDLRGAALNQLGHLFRLSMGAPLLGVALSALAPSRARPASATVAQTTASTPPHEVSVVHRLPSERWAWTELLRDPDPHLVQQNFHPRQLIRDPELIEAFGSDHPPSGDVVLMYAGDPPPGVKRQETPVILVHGATKNGQYWQTESPLAEHLRQKGFSVFAVSFAHSQDDNYFQAQALANAIERVKQVSGQPRVDLVAHSKGGVSARMYASGFRQDWMTPYRGDVRKLMLVAAPNGGLDYSFRHPVANFVLAGASNDPHLNAPMSWDKVLTPTGMADYSKMGFGKEGPDYFPGQRQLLARWDGDYHLPVVEQDWYTTYHGGRGFVSRSEGIDHYIAESGHFMERLGQTAIDPRVQVCILAGDNPDIPGILNEYTGPSDGLLFLRSAIDIPRDANVVAEAILPLNHKSLLSEKQGLDWVTENLAAPALKPLSDAQRRRIEAPAFR